MTCIENPKDTKKNLELINSEKLQDTKSIHRSLLQFYTPVTNYQKKKLRQSHSQLH